MLQKVFYFQFHFQQRLALQTQRKNQAVLKAKKQIAIIFQARSFAYKNAPALLAVMK